MRLKFSTLSQYYSNRLLERFVAGIPARTAADLVGLNRRTAIHFYHRLRTIIAWQIEEAWAFSGASEVGESSVGAAAKGNEGFDPHCTNWKLFGFMIDAGFRPGSRACSLARPEGRNRCCGGKMTQNQ